MSILRTAARASVATRVIGNTHRRQQRRWAAEDQAAAQRTAAQQAPARAAPPAPAAPAAETGDLLTKLTQLGQLRDSGVLTDAEFEAQKARILAAG